MQEPLPRRILVTGGSGVLGYHILHALVRDPRNQVIVPLRNPNNRLLAGLPVDAIHANLSDALQTGELIRSTRPDTVIHAAASGLRAPKPNWFETARFNVDAALRLFEATCEIADCHFIHISSGMAYRETGRPLCESDPLSSLHPYAASKAAGDLLLRTRRSSSIAGLPSCGLFRSPGCTIRPADCFRQFCNRLPCINPLN